jgi:hypothetical protein
LKELEDDADPWLKSFLPAALAQYHTFPGVRVFFAARASNDAQTEMSYGTAGKRVGTALAELSSLFF